MTEKLASAEIDGFFTKRPWMIAVVIFGGLMAIVFIEPVIMHYAQAWWKFWLG